MISAYVQKCTYKHKDTGKSKKIQDTKLIRGQMSGREHGTKGKFVVFAMSVLNMFSASVWIIHMSSL